MTLPFGVPVLPADTFLEYSPILPCDSVQMERDVHELSCRSFTRTCSAGRIWPRRCARLSRSSARSRVDCRVCDSGGELRRGGGDRLLRAGAGFAEGDQRAQQLFFLGGRANYSGECVILVGENAKRSGISLREAGLGRRCRIPVGAVQSRRSRLCLPEAQRTLGELWANFKMMI